MSDKNMNKPAETVDTRELTELMENWLAAESYAESINAGAKIIAHIDAHTARAVAAADKAARQNLARVLGLGVSGIGSFAWDYLLTLVASAVEDQPVQQPAEFGWCIAYGGEITKNIFHDEVTARACYDRLNADYPGDKSRRALVPLYTARVPTAGVQGDAKPNADCSGDPTCCPDNESYGCACSQAKPDSGRDAALEVKSAHGLLSTFCVGETKDGKAASLAQRITELYQWYYAATQPETGPINDEQRHAIATCINGGVEMGWVSDDMARSILAAHPANGAQAGLSNVHRAVIAEAAQVFESAATHNRSESRTVFAHEQQKRADQLREVLLTVAPQKKEGSA